MKLPKFAAFSRYRPRVLTLVVVFLIAAPITLANITSEIVPADSAIHGRETTGTHQGQYGWPLIWHWHNLLLSPGPCGIFNWEYSAARLAGNVALWLLLLAVPTGGCEWLLRRNRPGLRFSLRTMLVAVAVAAVCCAWFAAARNRASLQDPLIAEFEQDHGMDTIMIERPGPKWLEFIVPDRFRRHIIGIEIDDMMLDEALARRLARLPRLQYLSAHVERWTPGMTDALAGMRRLRWLCISRYPDDEPKQSPRKHSTVFDALMRWLGGESESPEGEGSEAEDSEGERSGDEGRRASREFHEGIGKLTQIEALCLNDWEDFPRDQLARVAGLANLKLLVVTFGTGTQGSLSHFPALPQLETIHIEYSEVSGQDLRHLAVFPRLKSLDLTHVEFDGAELGDLAPLKSLEELSIAATSLSKQTLESLLALKRLKSLSIYQDFPFEESDRTASLALDEGDQLEVPEGEAEVFRRALQMLRQSNPGIVIKKTPLGVYTFDISPPFEYEDPVLYSTWLPGDSRLLPPSGMRQLMRRLGAAPASPAGQSTADESKAEREE
ncbi:MAG TPA: hypothetical protein VMV10_12535 [Pirellulales bacterium]|nr:hypothetical protein [Pirellulales bacterium]